MSGVGGQGLRIPKKHDQSRAVQPGGERGPVFFVAMEAP